MSWSLLAMNEKMSALIEAKVGEPDDGRFLPGDSTKWVAATFDP